MVGQYPVGECDMPTTKRRSEEGKLPRSGPKAGWRRASTCQSIKNCSVRIAYKRDRERGLANGKHGRRVGE